MSLLRRIKKNCYSNLNEKNITDKSSFGKRLRHFFQIDKVLSTETGVDPEILKRGGVALCWSPWLADK